MTTNDDARAYNSTDYYKIRIVELEKRVTELEATLLPFARYATSRANAWTAHDNSAYYGIKHNTAINITYGDFRRAISVMGLTPAPALTGRLGKPLSKARSVGVHLEHETLVWIDANRGDLTRSAHVRGIIEGVCSGPRYQHLKRGSVVQVRGVAEVQTDTPIIEGDRVVFYVHEQDETKWVRLESEFNDGRFRALK